MCIAVNSGQAQCCCAHAQAISSTRQTRISCLLEKFFDSDEAVEREVWPLYSYVWYDFNDKFYYGMGDGRADNITAQYSNYIYPYTNFTETSLSQGLTEAWAALYSVVAQSNNAINNIRNFSQSSVSEDAKNRAIAEARFMRGVAYWYIRLFMGLRYYI